MVVTDLPATSFICVRQLRVAAPSRWTVHAPQYPPPQPNLVPVSSATSRRYHSSGISGSPSNCRLELFTLKRIMQHQLTTGTPLRLFLIRVVLKTYTAVNERA